MDDARIPSGRIAIVGIAGRFSGAETVGDLWRMLSEGREATTWLDDDALLKAGASPEDIADPNYVKAAMVLPNMEMFDAGFFGFSPREAQILDPQHRHFLETCWEALEDAAHVPRKFAGSIGVFGGCGMQAYMADHLMPNKSLRDSVGMFLLRHTGNDKDFLTTRVSYLLDLKGPSIGVQTACSTSLVAVHIACQSLMAGECDMALAGGVSIELPHRQGYIAAEGEILSPTGHCAAFDDDSKGTLFGSGAAVVVLRRLEDAIADGDNIRAVILGTAVNNDGASKAGYLAPSVEGQARAAEEAVAIAGVEPSSVDYIEAHGTGTVIGDPIELEALRQAYGQDTRPGTIGIGSIKTNIGHLDTAAGTSSLIKVVMSLEHELIPPSLNFKTPNSRFAFAESPFAVASAPRAWRRGPRPRRAGVNSLGVGGTNAHVVIEEGPALPAAGTPPEWEGAHLFTLSAKSDASLDRLAAKWQAFAADTSRPLDLASAAFTTAVGRETFDKRLAVVARTQAELAEVLAGRRQRRLAKGAAARAKPRLVFMFPGGGAQYAGAGRGLYRSNATFREAADTCLALMPTEACGLGPLLFGDEAKAPDAGDRLEHPLLSVLAVFTLSYAYSRAWASLGIVPAAVIGHSAGDYAAAVVAGVMRLEDAIGLVAERGRIFSELPPGAMLSVNLPEAELARRIGAGLDIAVANAPELTVASGPVPAIEQLAFELERDGIDSTRVRIGVAAHSRMLDSHLARFRQRLDAIRLSAPTIPMISSLTGRWANPSDLADPQYWVRHLRETVRFGDGLATVLADPNCILLEVGPGRGLGSLARLITATTKPRAIIASARSAIETDDDTCLFTLAAGELWANGAEPDLARLRAPGTPRRIPVPTYAFERQRHWIERPAVIDAPAPRHLPIGAEPAPREPKITRLAAMADWFSTPVMIPESAPAVPLPAAGTSALIVAARSALADAIAADLERRGVKTLIATLAETTRLESDGAWQLDRSSPSGPADLVAAVERAGARPSYLLVLDPQTEPERAATATARFDRLSGVLRAITLAGWDHPMRLAVATCGLLAAEGETTLHPEAALLMGPTLVWPRETPGTSAVLVDLPLEPQSQVALATRIVDEALAASKAPLVALRPASRLVLRPKPVPTGEFTSHATPRLKQDGVYLVTGGFGGIGTLLVRYLRDTFDARLALVGRRPASTLPPDAQRLLVEQRDRIVWLEADVTDRSALARAIDAARIRFDRIDGVIHAAGIIDDAPLATKSADSVHAVLAPKVTGGENLHLLLPPGTIDLFAVFSSTSALLGPPGQIDYVAANAYLAALASSRPDGLVIDWGIWRDTGMASRSRQQSARDVASRQPAPIHPLLGQQVACAHGTTRFEAVYAPSALWALSEHVVAGSPVLPGTAYLELMHLAVRQAGDSGPWAIEKLELLSPMLVPFGAERHVTITVDHSHPGSGTIEIASTADDTGRPILHARATARREASAPSFAAIPTLADAARVPEAELIAQRDLVEFGPRWTCLREVSVAGDRAWARLALPPDAAGDLGADPLHPALADMAATIGLHLVPEAERRQSLFVPASVARLTVLGPLPAAIVSEARLTARSPGESATFDVRIADAGGRVLVALDGLEMRALPRSGFSLSEHASPANFLARLLAAGIRSADAPLLFAKAFAAPVRRLVVSSIALDSLDSAYAALAAPNVPTPSSADAATANLAAAAATPGMTPTEVAIAGMFSELLGVASVGPDDEFLNLGGHSLSAVRLFARIRRQLGADLGMSTLLEAPSVRTLAAIVDEVTGRVHEAPSAPPSSAGTTSGPSQQSTAAPISPAPRSPAPQRRARKSHLVRLQKGEPGHPTLFWVHGAMGNVVSMKTLASALPSKYPIYGIEAQGVDGRLPPLEKVEDMAIKYVAGIREVEPAGPYYLMGYSGGGVVGYEMARQFALTGDRVALLIMIDTLAPTHAHGTTLLDWIRFSLEYGIAEAADQAKFGVRERYLALKNRFARTPAPTDDSADALVLNSARTFKAYIRAQQRYFMQPLDADILLFRAARAGIAFLKAGRWLGWDHHVAQSRIEVVDIDANHGTIVDRPAVDSIARVLDERLAALSRLHGAERSAGSAETSSAPSSTAVTPPEPLASGDTTEPTLAGLQTAR